MPIEDCVTGYEPKILRVVIENWLWNPSAQERVRAGTEVRKRFQKTFPKPDWAKQEKKDA